MASEVMPEREDNVPVSERADRLVRTISNYHRCVVAFSAGVDSTVVAKAAFLALGDAAMAVTAVSPSLASGELEEAQKIAQQIGIQHEVIHTNEVANAEYQKNHHDRCYFCKTELYDQISHLVQSFPDCVIVNGTNRDDLGDHRPGLVAAAEHNVRSPMVECQMDKAAVRALAAYWELPVWNKPAMPCLSSRIAYGVEVTPERLAMIDNAEQFLRELDFREFRVRYHEGDVARIEVPADELARVVSDPCRTQLQERLERIGFKFVTVDLAGFRSGSLNAMISVDDLRRSV